MEYNNIKKINNREYKDGYTVYIVVESLSEFDDDNDIDVVEVIKPVMVAYVKDDTMASDLRILGYQSPMSQFFRYLWSRDYDAVEYLPYADEINKRHDLTEIPYMAFNGGQNA